MRSALSSDIWNGGRGDFPRDREIGGGVIVPDAFTRTLRVLQEVSRGDRGSSYCFTFPLSIPSPVKCDLIIHVNIVSATYQSSSRWGSGACTGVRQFGPIITLYRSTWAMANIDLK